MTITLQANNVGGVYDFARAEKIADYLLEMGRAIPPARWVTGLVRRNRHAGNASVLGGL